MAYYSRALSTKSLSQYDSRDILQALISYTLRGQGRDRAIGFNQIKVQHVSCAQMAFLIALRVDPGYVLADKLISSGSLPRSISNCTASLRHQGRAGPNLFTGHISVLGAQMKYEWLCDGINLPLNRLALA